MARSDMRDFEWDFIKKLALPAQRYRIRRRISQLRFLDSALLHPVCEVGVRGSKLHIWAFGRTKSVLSKGMNT